MAYVQVVCWLPIHSTTIMIHIYIRNIYIYIRNIHIYICIYIRNIHIYIYVYMYVYLSVCLSVCLYVCMYVQVQRPCGCVKKLKTYCPRIGWRENLQETTMFGGEKPWFSLQPPLLRTEASTATEFEKNVEATIRPAGKWLITRFCHGFAKKKMW